MITCPVCDAEIDVEDEEVDEGDVITCDECGADLRVTGVDPLDVEPLEEEEEEEDEDDADLEEDEEEDESWR
jgi:alpha-aminoadipate carrier protein LysW